MSLAHQVDIVEATLRKLEEVELLEVEERIRTAQTPEKRSDDVNYAKFNQDCVSDWIWIDSCSNCLCF